MKEPIDPAVLLHRRILRTLGITSLWLPCALFFALSMPMLGSWPTEVTVPLGIVAIGITFVLIWKNLRCGLELVGRTGQTIRALPNTIGIFLLYTALFVQILCHLGAEHFQWRTLPEVKDWLAFTTAHAVRAGDILDVIEAYQLDIQAIQHRSIFVTGVLVTFHLMMGLFVLSLVTEGVTRIRRAIWGVKPFRVLLSILAVPLVLGAIFAAWSSVMQISPASGGVSQRDLLLWPVEDIVRLIDVADVMVLFNLHFHNVPPTPAISTFSVLLRLVVGLFLLRWIHGWYLRISLRSFGGFGLSQRDLAESLSRTSLEQVRERITHRLDRMQEEAASVRTPWYALVWFVIVGAVCFPVYSQLERRWPAWDASAIRLARALPDVPGEAELRRMGPYAEDAITVLIEKIEGQPIERQRMVLSLIGGMGSKAGPTLDRFVNGGDSELAMLAAISITSMGVNGVPWMVWGLESPHAEARQILEAGLRARSVKTIPRMLEMLSLSTAPQLLPILESVDPYWSLRRGTLLYQKVQQSHFAISKLEERDFGSDQNPWGLLNQFQEIHDIGPQSERALPSVPFFLEYIHDHPNDKSLLAVNRPIWEMVRRLGARSNPLIPDLVKHLSLTPPTELPFCITTLHHIDPDWRKSEAAEALLRELIDDLKSSDDGKRDAAITMLHYFDEEAKPALAVVKSIVGSEAATRLGELLQCKSDDAKITWAKRHLETPEAWVVLDRMGGRTQGLVPLVRERLEAKMGLANQAPELQFLIHIGEPVVADLIPMLADARYEVRENAATILMQIGRPAIPHLLTATVSDDTEASTMADRILTDMHPMWRVRYGIEK